jgi:dTDP-4-amino-4,6-dideoxygalactose transaminase
MDYFKPISISLSPNTEKDDIQLAFRLLFQSWRWKTINNKQLTINTLEEEFKRYLGVKFAVSFNSGRSAFLAILNSLSLNKGDEVLLQAFTCNAVPNPIIWAGLKPIYVDCDERNFNIDIEDLKRTLRQAQGKKPKVLMVQHTFGLPADLDEILEICQENKLILIEDCAHSLGATYKGKKVGNFGKASFFSFGRDKIISSVYGGMAVTNDENLAKKIKKFQEKCDLPSNFWIFQQLLHPILVNFLILPLYGFFDIGRLILLFFQKIKILSKAVSKKEKKGKKPVYFPKRFPNALAVLALNQLKKLERFILHQKEIARFYGENLKNTNFILPKENQERVYMRYSVLIGDYETDEILKKSRKSKIFLNDGWRKTPITPPDTNQKAMEYLSGSCSTAEKIAKTILNLPTHINISQKDAQKIIDSLKNSIKHL